MTLTFEADVAITTLWLMALSVGCLVIYLIWERRTVMADLGKTYLIRQASEMWWDCDKPPCDGCVKHEFEQYGGDKGYYFTRVVSDILEFVSEVECKVVVYPKAENYGENFEFDGPQLTIYDDYLE